MGPVGANAQAWRFVVLRSRGLGDAIGVAEDWMLADRRVRVPVDSPTSVTFGGPDLDILFVTSQGDAHVPGDAAPPKPSPLAGRVFAVHGLGVRGLPERRFGG
jgi:sugar lactone lactonase YvrE